MLVNIFGGIMKCDVIAEGVVAAAREVQLKVPLVVRLEGTNVEQGKEILRKSGLTIIPADNLRQAAREGGGRGPGREGVMSILVDQNTRVLMQGITGSAGSFHAGQMLDYGTQARGRRDARQGRTRVPGPGPDLQHRRRGGEADRRQRQRHLRPAAVRRRRDPRGRRRGRPADHHHHRGHPGAGHGAGEAGAAGPPGAPGRARTAPGSSPPARSARSGSCPATSTSRGGSASSRAPAR